MTTTDQWPPLSKAAVPASLTLEAFAQLPPSWPDSIQTHGGVLLARIHPDNNRPAGDEDVLARALVFNPELTISASPIRGTEETTIEGHLGRLTIRTTSLLADKDDDDTGRYIAWMYIQTLREVMKLPVITLRSEDPIPFLMCPGCETSGSGSLMDVGGICDNCGYRDERPPR